MYPMSCRVFCVHICQQVIQNFALFIILKLIRFLLVYVGEGEELIIPGDKQEIAEFIDAASRNARLQVEISLPRANVHFPSKHLYEVVYNR